MAHPTKDLLPAAAVPAAPTSQRRPRRRLIASRKLAAALTAGTLLSLSLGGGPLAAAGIGVQPAAAQSVLNQAQGGSSGGGSGNGLQQAQQKGSNLNVKPNWNAPGISQGKALIGWAKAGAVVLGVLGMIGGVVGGAVLKNAGNHHASGVRATALSIGGAMVVAGTATTLIPSLMG